jgi:nucleoside-diphosphate-sugar epimerase
MTAYTILGSKGFIGSHLARSIREKSISCYCPGRDEKLPEKDLGHIVYCIGLTADFRTRPYDTVDAHVCTLLDVIRNHDFDSLTYLSSARVYQGNCNPCTEESTIQANPLDPNDLYNISKVMGEAVCFASGKKVRVVRLSNVYGDDFTSENFLSSVIRDAVVKRKVVLNTSLDSEKDYISIHDVINILPRIAEKGQFSLYNVASGRNTSNLDIMKKLQDLTLCEITVNPGAKKVCHPPVSIEKIQREFSFSPSNLLDDLQKIIIQFRDT